MKELMLYELSNLTFSYAGVGTKVLHVKDLIIPRRKIVVILGLSGIGKSTLLESLGLMNNTVIQNDETVFRFYGKGNGEFIDFSKIWARKSDLVLSDIRNKHFSFIFQDTNLMPNFSVIENVIVTLMIQGFSNKKARNLAMEYMEKIGIGDIDPNKKVFELAGGQRQRIAFIRAICPDFTVLLGDEPTGNLDRFNSRNLMQILQENIHEKKGSAIIVSHDIDLSVEFADQLIIIRKQTDNNQGAELSYGLIEQGSIYNLNIKEGKKYWKNGKESYEDETMKQLIRRNLGTQKITD